MLTKMKQRLVRLERLIENTGAGACRSSLAGHGSGTCAHCRRRKSSKSSQRMNASWMTGIAMSSEELYGVGRESRPIPMIAVGNAVEPGGYLLDALQEVHRDCWYRTKGVCQSCLGTPVAESHIAP